MDVLHMRYSPFLLAHHKLSPLLRVVAGLCLKHGVARIIIVMVVVGIYGVWRDLHVCDTHYPQCRNPRWGAACMSLPTPPFPSSQLCERPYTIRIMDYGLLDREYTIEEATGFVSPKIIRQFFIIGLSMCVPRNKTLAYRMWGSPNRVNEDYSGVWLRWEWYKSTNVSHKLSFSIFMDCLEE